MSDDGEHVPIIRRKEVARLPKSIVDTLEIDYAIAFDLLRGYGVSDADLGSSKTKIQEP